MKRLHVHVGVADLDRSVAFYSTLFGAPPTTVKSDYAKWMLDDPRVNFAISTGHAEPGIEHLGIQAEDAGELAEVYRRLEAADRPVLEEGATTCCYARSEKSWIADPDGVTWEAFLTHGEATVYGGGPELARLFAERRVDLLCAGSGRGRRRAGHGERGRALLRIKRVAAPRLVKLERGALAEVRQALRDAGLPADDIVEEEIVFYRFEDAAGPIGWAAFEPRGEEALLRSVLVLPQRRLTGAGAEMIRRVMAAASADGVRRLWLLTESAAPFFTRLGFSPADRSHAPVEIAATSEFRSICPASAACMTISLGAPARGAS